MATPPLVRRNRYVLAVQSMGILHIGNYLLVCNWTNGVNVYEIDGDNLTLASNVPITAGATYDTIYYDGTYVFVCGNNSLNVYTFNDTTGILTYITRILLAHCHNITFDGTNYYVTGGANPGNQVLAYTFDGANFTLLDTYTHTGICNELFVDNGYIFVSSADGALAFSFDGVNLNLLATVLPGNTVRISVYSHIIHAGVPAGDYYRYSFDGANFNLINTYAPVGGLSNFLDLFAYLDGTILTLTTVRVAVIDEDNDIDTYYDYTNPAGIIVRALYVDGDHAYLTGLELDTLQYVIYVLELATPVLIADFSFSPLSGKAPLKVQFQNESRQRYI